MTDGRKRYVLCGLSNRGIATFARPILGPATARGQDETRTSAGFGYGVDGDNYADVATLVGIVDPDAERARAFNESQLRAGLPTIPTFAPDEFDRMLADTGPEALIVTSPDHTHAEYIEAGVEAGLDVISEKPMTATAEQAAGILRIADRGRIRVSHNLRYTPRHRAVRKLISEGAVGRVLQVTLDYHVDIRHGASYFVRWNRRRDCSGGLTVHKSCHHLDLINWLINDLPDQLYARGGRNFYGTEGAHRPRDGQGRPISGDQLAEADPYYRAQHGSGVLPLFGDGVRTGSGFPYALQYRTEPPMTIYDSEIDIEDTYSALIGYRGGASASYSIDFSSPWEGYRLGISGTEGRIETSYGHDLQRNPLPGNDAVRLLPLFGPARTIEVDTGGSGHDGADPIMRSDLFGTPSEESLRLGLPATVEQAAYAVAAGEAISRSITSGTVIDIGRLLAAPEHV
ncbi:MAG TPA: Gfo/Idh/MocA family oxidoreductase [Microlunatus sp.]